MRNPYRSPAIEQGLSPFRNVNMLAGIENFPEFFTRKRRASLVKARLLEKYVPLFKEESTELV